MKTLLMKDSFFRHPIKWFRARKLRPMVQAFLDSKYPEWGGEVRKAMCDQVLYGSSFMKGGKHISFTEVFDEITTTPTV